ncbi:MAG: hydrogenase nickel incorporation protein HypB [Propionibacteriaceae bacterium]|jgi:hydrogenase nickel incorporation protein HypB|nr:hydrogenase nickel incorporation protein HypB [Propionibacteriaceae bacterium]
MGRFHRHDDGTVHSHEHDSDGHGHPQHDHDHPADHHSHEHHDHGADGHSHDHGAADHDHSAAADWAGDHSGYATGAERVEVLERIFDENDQAAARNRAAFDAHQVTAVNLMSAPGSGKTAILAQVLRRLRGRVRVGVVEGDIETAIDADRLAGLGAQIALLNTGHGFGGECHLDAPMVAHALADLDLASLDLVLIENVGNLVCPAEFDVGAHRRAMVCSVTEGEDKPLKYPVMFRAVDLVIVNKIDLLPHLDFDLALFEANLKAVNPQAAVLHCSAKTGQGLEAVTAWLEG